MIPASVNLIRLEGPQDKPTMGRLSFGGIEFASLEPAQVNPYHAGHPCIPKGTYKLALVSTPKHGPDTPMIMDVPKRNAILIHSGNTDKDTEGCVLIGMARNGYTISDSRKAVDVLKLWMKQNEADKRPMQIVVL